MRTITAAEYRAELAKKRKARPVRKQRNEESQRLRSILAYLETIPGAVAWRQNSGMIRGTYKGKPWAVKLGKPGLPDLFLLLDGQLYGFEVKRPGQKLRATQERMFDRLRKSGAVVARVETVEDVRWYVGANCTDARARMQRMAAAFERMTRL